VTLGETNPGTSRLCEDRYFPFEVLIAVARREEVLRFGTTTEDERAAWIEALTIAASGSGVDTAVPAGVDTSGGGEASEIAEIPSLLPSSPEADDSSTTESPARAPVETGPGAPRLPLHPVQFRGPAPRRVPAYTRASLYPRLHPSGLWEGHDSGGVNALSGGSASTAQTHGSGSNTRVPEADGIIERSRRIIDAASVPPEPYGALVHARVARLLQLAASDDGWLEPVVTGGVRRRRSSTTASTRAFM
jgi:hypothetical protein